MWSINLCLQFVSLNHFPLIYSLISIKSFSISIEKVIFNLIANHSIVSFHINKFWTKVLNIIIINKKNLFKTWINFLNICEIFSKQISYKTNWAFVEMIRIISFVLIITVYCVNVNSDRVETDGSATLNSLEDIEVLTYFLLWKYNYFQNNDYKVDETQFNSQDISNDNDINESKLRLFIENLKDNKLIQHITNSSSSLTSIDNTIKSCNNIDQSLVKKWQNNMSANKIKVLLQI